MEEGISASETLQLIAVLSVPAVVAGLIVQFLWLRSRGVLAYAIGRAIASMIVTVLLAVPTAWALGLLLPGLLSGALNMTDPSTWLFPPGILATVIVVPTVTLAAIRVTGRGSRSASGSNSSEP